VTYSSGVRQAAWRTSGQFANLWSTAGHDKIRVDRSHRFAEPAPLSAGHREVVNAIFDEVVKALGRGDRVELRGFGAFSAKIRGARKGHNPRTGVEVQVAQKVIPFFKSGKEMRARLNGENAQPAESKPGEGELSRRWTIQQSFPIPAGSALNTWIACIAKRSP
jgi:integration host factor subunit beta